MKTDPTDTGGLFTGVIWTVAVERVNLWRRMPVEQYVVDFQRSVRRVDPLQPIMGTVCAVGAVVFAINSQGRPATLAWIAVGLIAVIMVASFVIAEPMNFRFILQRGSTRWSKGDSNRWSPRGKGRRFSRPH